MSVLFLPILIQYKMVNVYKMVNFVSMFCKYKYFFIKAGGGNYAESI